MHAPEAMTILPTSQGYAEVSDDAAAGDEWRRYGESRRSHLLSEDQESGGANFAINPVVRLNKYYHVVTRVCYRQSFCLDLFS